MNICDILHILHIFIKRNMQKILHDLKICTNVLCTCLHIPFVKLCCNETGVFIFILLCVRCLIT